MNNWFTVEQIDKDTYAISEYGHWEEPHSYLLLGEERAVIIDTGLGVADIRKEAEKITGLPISAVTTHVHWDHIGGHGLFNDFAVHEEELSWINGGFPLPISMVRRDLARPPRGLPEGFDENTYEVFQGEPSRILKDGDTIDLGGRRLRVIHTPGHSPGHCCFYEEARGYLYSGDIAYMGCLYAFYPSTDPKAFYRSIKKLEGLDIKKILPGHHSLEVPNSIICDISKGFASIEQCGGLAQGRGEFDFGYFGIHI